jgi:PEP-CTERM motif
MVAVSWFDTGGRGAIMTNFVTRCRDFWICSSSHICLLLLTFCALPYAQTHSAAAATLEDLIDGATLNAGNLRFSDWELVSLDSTQILAPDLSLITVTPLTSNPANPGFQLNGNGQLSIAGMNAIDLSLKFRVDALNGSNMMTGQTLAMTGINFASSGGISFITNELATSGGGNLESMLAIVDHETDFFQFTNAAAFLPKSSLIVTTNAYITGLSAGDGITLTSFVQSFAQTGPPSQTGDYNENGVVDAADFVIWRTKAGSFSPLPNDPLPGPIGASQYQQWTQHFGQGAIAGSSAALANGEVPEPGTLLSLIGLSLLAAIGRRVI